MKNFECHYQFHNRENRLYHRDLGIYIFLHCKLLSDAGTSKEDEAFYCSNLGEWHLAENQGIDGIPRQELRRNNRRLTYPKDYVPYLRLLCQSCTRMMSTFRRSSNVEVGMQEIILLIDFQICYFPYYSLPPWEKAN